MSRTIRIRDTHDRSYLLTDTGLVETGKTRYIVLRRDLFEAIATTERNLLVVGPAAVLQSVASYTALRQQMFSVRLRPSGALSIGCRDFNRTTGRLLKRWTADGVSGYCGVGKRK